MVLFRRCSPVLLLALFVPAISWAAQDPLKDTLQGIYNQTLTAMRSAKTTAEIRQIVNRIDMPQSARIATDGQVTTVTAEQTIHELEGQVAQPEKEIWKIDIIWVSRVQDEATTVAWIYKKSRSSRADCTAAHNTNPPQLNAGHLMGGKNEVRCESPESRRRRR